MNQCYCVYIDGSLRIIAKTKTDAILGLIKEKWINGFTQMGDKNVSLFDCYGSRWKAHLIRHPEEIDRIEDIELVQHNFYC